MTGRGVRKTWTDPAVALSQLNRRMLLHNIFATAKRRWSMRVLDPRIGVMKIASAGMEGPLHVTPAGCHEMTMQALPPGMFLSANYESVTPGDSIVFFQRWIE